MLFRSAPEITLDDPNRQSEVDQLLSAVNEFYSLEQQKNWEETYNLRSPKFKQTVSKELYIKSMDEDTENYNLIKYNLISINIQGDRATINIEFIDREFEYRRIYAEEETIWMKIEDRWCPLYPGVRNYVWLNTMIVFE